MEEDIKLLIWPALDPKFKPGISDAGFRGWWDKGITAICTLTHRGVLKSPEQLQKEFELENKDFFRYLQIRDYYDKRIKPTLSRKDNAVTDILIEACSKKNKKIICRIYQGLQKQNGNSTGSIKTKWEEELNIEISQEDWHSVWSAQHSSTSSRKWRIFVWKNRIHFFHYTTYREQTIPITRAVLEALWTPER